MFNLLLQGMSEFGNFEFHNFSSIFCVESVIRITSSVFSDLEKPKRWAGNTSLDIRRPISVCIGSSRLQRSENEAVVALNNPAVFLWALLAIQCIVNVFIHCHIWSPYFI